jgi:CheY-like chemotaxis protein
MSSLQGGRVSEANILLVDDNDDVREITALLLGEDGYNVIGVPSGSLALGVLDTNPAIDLLIVDYLMPEMSGVQLIREARAKQPEIRAIVITGYGDDTRLSGEFADEIVVKKPFTKEQLVLAVRDAIDRRGTKRS